MLTAVGRDDSITWVTGAEHTRRSDAIHDVLAAVDLFEIRDRCDSAAGPGGNQVYLTFGHGEHRCPFPAQELAEVVAQTAVEVLLDRLPDLTLAVPAEDLVWNPAIWVRGLATLPVTFTPA